MGEFQKLIADTRRWIEQEKVWDDQLWATQKQIAPEYRSIGVSEKNPVTPSHQHPDIPLPHHPVTPTQAVSPKTAALQALYQKYHTCTACSLGLTRIKFVFGVGNPEAQVLFIGEGPGYEEDRRGEPFVGPAGQLLDKILASIGLSRQTNAYIANIVKCHPMVHPETPEARGNDRAPLPIEVETCSPILKAQIAIIQPRVIVTLGSPSTKAILQTTEGITRMRGKLYPLPQVWLSRETRDEEWETAVLPTYHPSALLRNPVLKKDTWEDMKLLRETLAKL